MPDERGILSELRKSKGLTQRYLSKKFGVSTSTISAYEHGKREPPTRILLEMVKEFDVSLDYLLGLTACAVSLSVLHKEYVEGVEMVKVIEKMQKLSPGRRKTISDMIDDMFACETEVKYNKK